jgi:hypothetical protein
MLGLHPKKSGSADDLFNRTFVSSHELLWLPKASEKVNGNLVDRLVGTLSR